MRGISAFALLFLLLESLQAEVSFITKDEYASQLYHNPRGIGCHKCHGENGEGRLIATYKEKGVEKAFRAPPIDQVDYTTFVKVMTERQRGMPRYFLTAQEIKVLYYYLHPKE
jgi:mono/diheme cytochrome c family protein